MHIVRLKKPIITLEDLLKDSQTTANSKSSSYNGYVAMQNIKA